MGQCFRKEDPKTGCGQSDQEESGKEESGKEKGGQKKDIKENPPVKVGIFVEVVVLYLLTTRHSLLSVLDDVEHLPFS